MELTKREEEAYESGKRQGMQKVYIQAVALAHKEDQTVGEDNDYYITLEQLELIIKSLNL